MAPKKQKQVTKKEVAVAAPAAAGPGVDPEQALKASKALLAHIKKASTQAPAPAGKKSLLDEIEPSGELTLADTPVWLTLTTKRHVSDTSRLKPARISLPHALHSSPHETICLITADPQRAYKDIIASDAFPEDLRKRITRVIGYEKVRAKYRQYEAQRRLLGEHDVFLGDDRIINRLPQALGKTFYKTTAKRPVPVVLRQTGRQAKKEVRRKKGDEEEINAASEQEIAAEIKSALGAALVSLSPSTNTAVKVGYASWTPEQIAENVKEVATVLVEKHVPKGWANVKSIFVKGPETTALPIWQTEELWVDGRDVAADEDEETKKIEGEQANVGKKRKALEGQEKKGPLSKKARGEEGELKGEIEETKTRLRKSKAKAMAAMEG